MVDQIILFAGIRRDVGHRQCLGQCGQLGRLAGHALEAGLEIGQVFRQLLGRIPLGVDTDHGHAQALARGGRKGFCHCAQVGHGRRADVRTEGIAEKQQIPLAHQVLLGPGITGGGLQFDAGQAARAVEQEDTRVGQHIPIQRRLPIDLGHDGAQHQGDGRDCHQNGFLHTTHSHPATPT